MRATIEKCTTLEVVAFTAWTPRTGVVRPRGDQFIGGASCNHVSTFELRRRLHQVSHPQATLVVTESKPMTSAMRG
jgi:hypothetical protein